MRQKAISVGCKMLAGRYILRWVVDMIDWGLWASDVLDGV
jgi:hypothetical protein